MNDKAKKIVYLVQLPPPVHGVSVMNDLISSSDLIHKGIYRDFVKLRFSGDLKQLRKFSFSKIFVLFRILIQLRRILGREKPGLVYFSFLPVGKGFWRDLLFVRMLKKRNQKILFHLHNRGMGERSGSRFWGTLYRWVFKDSILVHLSEGLMREEVTPFEIPGVKAYVVRNAIPDIVYSIEDWKTRRRTEKIRVLFFSNLFPEKGIYNLVEIFHQARQIKADMDLTIGGEFLRERYKHRLEEMIQNNNLTDAVRILGPLSGPEKHELFNQSDIFLFPSYFRQECMPLVVIEAMRSGIPVIASKVGAIPDIVRDGKEGLLIDERDTHGFARALSRLADDSNTRRKMGHAARERFVQAFSLPILEAKMREIILENI